MTSAEQLLMTELERCLALAIEQRDALKRTEDKIRSLRFMLRMIRNER